MRKLSSIANTTVSSDYPDGAIRNKAGATAGTPLVEAVGQDIIQAFQKLMRDASISYNNLPDNETNGYQTLQAMNDVNDLRYKYSKRIVTESDWNVYSDSVDNIIIPDKYYITPFSGSETNLPDGNKIFSLIVIKDAVSSSIIQSATTLNDRRMFYRIKYSGVWSDWIESTIYSKKITDSNYDFTDETSQKESAIISIGSTDTASYDLTLPRRLTFSKSFIIKNHGTGLIAVKKFGGIPLLTIHPNELLVLMNSTSNSDWAVMFRGYSQDLDNYKDAAGNESTKVLKEMVLEIGAWDMNNNQIKSIPWSGFATKKIVFVDWLIISNSGNAITRNNNIPLSSDYSNNIIFNIGSSDITFDRLTGGHFDSAAYGSGLANRGYIYIKYFD